MNSIVNPEKEAYPPGLKPRPKRNQFLACLHRALEKKEYQNILCWQDEGLAFVLKSPLLIEEKVLAEEFGGMKFSSFIRQLNYYGFKRISSRANAKVYYHEQFKRDGKEGLNNIRRKNKRVESEQVDEIFPLKELNEKHKRENIELLMREKIQELEEEILKVRNENRDLRFKIIRLNQGEVENELKQVPNFRPSFTGFNVMNPVSERFQNLLVSRNNSDFNSLFPNSYANDLSFVMNALDQPNFIETYQPDSKGNQPNFETKLPDEMKDSSSMIPWALDPTDFNFGKNNSVGFPENQENSDENVWNFEGYVCNL